MPLVPTEFHEKLPCRYHIAVWEDYPELLVGGLQYVPRMKRIS